MFLIFSCIYNGGSGWEWEATQDITEAILSRMKLNYLAN